VLWFVPIRDDAACLEWHHFPKVPDRRARITGFLDAYGTESLHPFDVAEDRGVEPQRTWAAEGRGDEEAAEIRWIEENRFLFTLREPQRRSSSRANASACRRPMRLSARSSRLGLRPSTIASG